MAYVPGHKADVFISCSHQDKFAWIEGFKSGLESILISKLRAETKPEIFLDADPQSLRAGRLFDRDIPDCLDATEFFVAIVSPRYLSSEYCRQKELPRFLRNHGPGAGRLIQVRVDQAASFPLSKASERLRIRPNPVERDVSSRQIQQRGPRVRQTLR
jgi:hypothetical protein